MEVVYNTRFLLRRGTADSWEHNNPVLAYGEPGYDVTNYGLKIGDGKTRWKDLDFLSASKEQIEEAINKYFEENPGSGTGGAPGKDGVSATHRWQGTTLIITSASGTSSANLKGEKGDPGKTPQKYVDYWTERDKQEIISEIPIPDLDGYATEEYVNKQIANAQLGSGSGSGSGSVDLSSYYTKSETNEVIQDAIEKIELTPGPKGDTPQKYIDYFTEEDVSEIVERVVDNIPEVDVDLTGYATEQWVSDKYQVKGNYLTEIPEEYAKTSEIPTRPEDIGAQPAGEYLTSVPDGYATQEYVKNKIAEASLSGGEVDLSGYATKEELPTKISQLENDKNYLTSYNETDPTVPDWAKASTKPTYTKTEVGLDKVDNIKQYSADNPPPYPVISVNGKTGEVILDADAVGARSSTWMPNASDVGALPNNTVIPTKTSQLNNDSGFLTEHIDISSKLDASKLPEAVNAALAQAKASGEFNGTDGSTFTPYVDSNGNLSWSNDKGLANPATVNIKGPKGDDGDSASVDLNNYYTKAETNTAINNAKPDLSQYASLSYANSLFYNSLRLEVVWERPDSLTSLAAGELTLTDGSGDMYMIEFKSSSPAMFFKNGEKPRALTFNIGGKAVDSTTSSLTTIIFYERQFDFSNTKTTNKVAVKDCWNTYYTSTNGWIKDGTRQQNGSLVPSRIFLVKGVV